MKKLFNLLCLDFMLILRDKIALYMAIAPMILSFVLFAVTGDMSKGAARLAVTSDVPGFMTDRLETVADVEIVDDYEALIARVGAYDSLAGVYMDNGEPAVLTEGNEKEGFEQENAALVSKVLYGNEIEFEAREEESSGNTMISIVTSSLILLALMTAGTVSGFNIVHERENRVIRAFAVSPTSYAGYIGAHIVTALILGSVNAALCAVIIGKSEALSRVLLIAVSSIFIYGIAAMLLGSFSSNRISAIGAMKLIMPLFLIVPVSSAFVPESFQFLYYPLPMYWQYDGVQKALSGNIDVWSPLLAILTGALWLCALMLLRKKIFGLRG